MAEPETPSSDDNTTTSPPGNRLLCPVCWTPFTRIRRLPADLLLRGLPQSRPA